MRRWTITVLLGGIILFHAPAALRAQEPAPAEENSARLAPNTGLSEEQVLALIVPDHKANMAEWSQKQHDPDDFFDEYGVGVEKEIITDLGLAGSRFLVASAFGHHGLCNGCYFWALGIIDLDRKRLVNTSGGEGSVGELRVFRMFPDDRLLSLAFRYSRMPMQHREVGEELEEWLRPRRAGRAIGFDPVLDVPLYELRSTTFDPDGPGEGGCGTLDLVKGRRAYDYTMHYFLGQTGVENAHRYDDLDSCTDRFGSDLHAVEIVRSQSLNWNKDHFDVGAPRFRRIDLRRGTDFPFRLPISVIDWRRTGPLTQVGGMSDDGPYIRSPDRKLRALVRKGIEENFLSIERDQDGYQLRRVDLGENRGTVGWAADSSRVFLVTKRSLGPAGEGNADRQVWILTSFAAKSGQDNWESILGEVGDSVVAKPPAGFDDGFVMSPAAH